jgi:hypothetical protein
MQQSPGASCERVFNTVVELDGRLFRSGARAQRGKFNFTNSAALVIASSVRPRAALKMK